LTAQTELIPEPQAVVSALTRAAIFLVAMVNPGAANAEAVRSFCGDLPALLRAVGFRDIEGNLSCVMGIGSNAWDRLFGQPRPAELHPFQEIRVGLRHAAQTIRIGSRSRMPHGFWLLRRTAQSSKAMPPQALAASARAQAIPF
jgi:deferrochelatase/peroxidase EfeB